MPNGIPEPALQPLHPEKPEPPIVAGYVWQKIGTGKTSVNAPRCHIERFERSIVDWTYSHNRIQTNRSSERVFRRDWRPC